MATRATDPPLHRVLRAAAALSVATVLAAGAVTLVQLLAAPQLEATRRARQLEQLTAVLGDVRYDNDPLADTLELRDPELLGSPEPLLAHRVRRDGATVALLLNVVAPDGYGGPIRLLVAVDAQGRVLGVRVLEHHETPGLGDPIDERRSDWIRGFDGRSLADPPAARWQVRRDGGEFEQFTGATITPRAVVRAVRRALDYVDRHRERLFGPAPGGGAAP